LKTMRVVKNNFTEQEDWSVLPFDEKDRFSQVLW